MSYYFRVSCVVFNFCKAVYMRLRACSHDYELPTVKFEFNK